MTAARERVREALVALHLGGKVEIAKTNSGELRIRPKGAPEDRGPVAYIDPQTGRWHAPPDHAERFGFVALGRYLGLDLPDALVPWTHGTAAPEKDPPRG